ncbi:hypothetical protein ABT56_12885 [Photobacterium aquae]|uniref:Uncharacterized protein n=1 Tax=Photobacterium aquae TaxID=1195763 RepID=A0A0J1GZP0_9GAMM|nr:hypothetical protein [Photobacterium aquae]KLV05088.1 hypothetical protein ABT56_12885 [Photobacterium aquae]
MNFFKRMLKKGKISTDDLTCKTVGEIITKATDGELLVEGKATYEIAHDKKHDLEVMMKCCESELNKYRITDQAPAPYYFERVAILARKAKDYDLEVRICERYIAVMKEIYGDQRIGIKAGPRFAAIEKRLPKAKQLQQKNT